MQPPAEEPAGITRAELGDLLGMVANLAQKQHAMEQRVATQQRRADAATAAAQILNRLGTTHGDSGMEAQINQRKPLLGHLATAWHLLQDNEPDLPEVTRLIGLTFNHLAAQSSGFKCAADFVTNPKYRLGAAHAYIEAVAPTITAEWTGDSALRMSDAGKEAATARAAALAKSEQPTRPDSSSKQQYGDYYSSSKRYRGLGAQR